MGYFFNEKKESNDLEWGSKKAKAKVNSNNLPFFFVDPASLRSREEICWPR